MKLLIVDAQGGGLGKQMIQALKKEELSCEITAVGTNSTATANMLKAGADHAATGENAVLVGCRNADVIIGPIGIVIADSLYGEITPAMAVAIGQSQAVKLLIPMNQCDNIVVGISGFSMNQVVGDIVGRLKEMS